MLYSFSLSLPLLLAAANGLLPALYYAPSILARLGASFAALALAIVLAHLEQRLRVSRAQRVASKAGAQSPPWPRGYLPLDFDIFWNFASRYFIEPPATYTNLKLHETGASIIQIPVVQYFFTSDPIIIKHALSGETFTSFVKGDLFHSIGEDFLGDGMLLSDGKQWKQLRSMTRPFFSRERLSDLDCFRRHTDHLLQVLDNIQAAPPAPGESAHALGLAFDFQDLAGRFTIDTGTDFLYGESVNSLADADPQSTSPSSLGDKGGSVTSRDFFHSFNAAQRILHERAALGDLWKLREAFGNRSTHHSTVVRQVVDAIIRRALERKAHLKDEVKASDGDKETYLEHLIQSMSDPTQLRDQTLNILIALRDTTSSTLTSSMYILAKHPAIFSQLRAHVLDVFGDDASREISADDIKGATYMRAFLDEILRMFPPVPFNLRHTVNDVILPDVNGKMWYVPKNHDFSYASYLTHRRKDLWGDDADNFDPERWLDDRRKRIDACPSMFHPFHLGPRLCLGQQFAYQEATFALVRLLQKYDTVELATDKQPRDSYFDGEILPVAAVTLVWKGGMHIRLAKAT